MKEKSARPPSLTVVGETPENGLKPPRKFGAAGESLWTRVQNDYLIQDVGGLELLAQCCAAADRAEALAAIIEVMGSNRSATEPHALGRGPQGSLVIFSTV